jgi:hypothetical protein
MTVRREDDHLEVLKWNDVLRVASLSDCPNCKSQVQSPISNYCGNCGHQVKNANPNVGSNHQPMNVLQRMLSGQIGMKLDLVLLRLS